MEYWLCAAWSQLWPNIKVLLASWHNNGCIILFLLSRYNMACAIKYNIRNYSYVTSTQWRKDVLPAFGKCRFCDSFVQQWSKPKRCIASVACSHLLMHHAVTLAVSIVFELFVVQTAHRSQLHIYGFPQIKCLGLLWLQDVTVIST